MTKIKELENGFKYLYVENKSASAKIAIQGAHIFHFQKKSEKYLLWVSEKSNFENGKAIRGGIPICWPWFGEHTVDKSLPKHGFARISQWELSSVKELDENHTEVIMTLSSSSSWAYKFLLTARFVISESLSLSVRTENLDDRNFTISQALHTYFSVNNIDEVKIDGLEKIEYIDFLNAHRVLQTGSILIDKEVDRIYQNVSYPLNLTDEKHSVKIDSIGSNSSVVWNPWKEKCVNMSDMQKDSYKNFVCLETTNTREDERVIKPKQSHTIYAKYSTS